MQVGDYIVALVWSGLIIITVLSVSSGAFVFSLMRRHERGDGRRGRGGTRVGTGEVQRVSKYGSEIEDDLFRTIFWPHDTWAWTPTDKIAYFTLVLFYFILCY